MSDVFVLEVGRTVRSAIGSWARTVRLCLLMLATGGIMLAYHLMI